VLSLSGMHKSPSVQGPIMGSRSTGTSVCELPRGQDFFKDEVFRLSPGGYVFDPDSGTIRTHFVEITSTNALGVIAFGFDSVRQTRSYKCEPRSLWLIIMDRPPIWSKSSAEGTISAPLAYSSGRHDAPSHPEVEDADFQVWLLYRAFVDILDLGDMLRSSINSRTQITW